MKTFVPPQRIAISPIDADGREFIEVGPLRLDLRTEFASINGYALALTSAEFRLLVHLLKNAGRVWAREELLEHISDGPSCNVRRVDPIVAHVRRKIGFPLIATARRGGYDIPQE